MKIDYEKYPILKDLIIPSGDNYFVDVGDSNRIVWDTEEDRSYLNGLFSAAELMALANLMYAKLQYCKECGVKFVKTDKRQASCSRKCANRYNVRMWRSRRSHNMKGAQP